MTLKVRGCAVVMSNGDNGVRRMEVGKHHAGKVFADILQKNLALVTINNDGIGEFAVNAGSVSVYVQNRTYLK